MPATAMCLAARCCGCSLWSDAWHPPTVRLGLSGNAWVGFRVRIAQKLGSNSSSLVRK